MTREVSGAMQALSRLCTATELLPSVDLVTRTLARREAVQSSQIEGTRTQLHELLEYEATQGSDGAPADAVVTGRYVQALEQGLATIRRAGTRQALDTRLLRALHATLMQDAPASLRAGDYRDTQAWIGSGRIEDATFVPAPPSRIEACMEELEASMLRYARREDEVWELPVVGQLAIAHAQFETIHPFADGNGRCGRLLMPLILAAEGYPPIYLSGTLLRQRRAYYDALADVQLRADWVPWIRLLCRAVVEACDGAVAIARDLEAIRAEWTHGLADLRSDAAARRLPAFLLGHPVVAVKQVAEGLGISFKSANKAIEALVSRGMLSEPTRRRNRVFHATEILRRLEQP
ncbi:Fic family protein [Arenimonas sp.]|uniref:Fic family protein n=1 Tax=Arenimonas sp. TaxID=1872635 RepID=UPI0035B43895